MLTPDTASLMLKVALIPILFIRVAVAVVPSFHPLNECKVELMELTGPQVWFMDHETLTSRQTVIQEFSFPVLLKILLVWSLKGIFTSFQPPFSDRRPIHPKFSMISC
jgi:hypothetical protein